MRKVVSTRWLIALPAILFALLPQSASAEPIVGLNAVGYTITDIPPTKSDELYVTCGSETENNINRSYDGEPFQQCGDDHFMIHMTGFIQIPEHQTIEFWIGSDDGGTINIGGNEFGVWQDQGCSATMSGNLTLAAGVQPLDLWMYENGGGTCILLAWKIDDNEWEYVPEEAFTNEPLMATTTTSTTSTSTTTTTSTTIPATTTTLAATTTIAQTTTTTTTTTSTTQPPSPPPGTTSTIPEPPPTVPPPPTTVELPPETKPAPPQTLPAPPTTLSEPPATMPAPPTTQPEPPETLPEPPTTMPPPPDVLVDPLEASAAEVATFVEAASSTQLEAFFAQATQEETLAVIDKVDSPAALTSVIQALAAEPVSAEVAVALISNDAIAELPQSQIEEVFAAIDTEALSQGDANVLVEALAVAPTKVKKAFEAAINVFSGLFNSYKMVGQTIPVSERRTLVAVGNIMGAVGMSLRRRL